MAQATLSYDKLIAMAKEQSAENLDAQDIFFYECVRAGFTGQREENLRAAYCAATDKPREFFFNPIRAAAKKLKASNGGTQSVQREVDSSWPVPNTMIGDRDMICTIQRIGKVTDPVEVPGFPICKRFEAIACIADPEGNHVGLRIKVGGREVTISIKELHSDKAELAIRLTEKYG